ncbi:hydantoinase B/oxoprolinase family protein [Amycolatopsis sp. NPDC049253]|uniref:hydantoinase B/oxoprolinase family protein n=1 Tax=Amycolatopsis sp. NPDC049253 TaxID=3155274 RepID=UPI00343A787B
MTTSEHRHIGLDPVALGILRSRLQATAEEGAITIERTAISPVISESRDYSSTLLEANGDLIVAGGALTHHFGVCSHAVRATLEAHGETLQPGDLFFANDPHHGGGLHAQDVLIQLPVFHGEELIAWVVNSGHMLDMGGMVFGSWSPEAVDCYQEALRLPPVHLSRAGVEQSEIWAVVLNNVRVPDVVEMDMRSLIAGVSVARDKLLEIATGMGVESFLHGVGELKALADREMRRRISALADGVYRYTSWTEWHGELYPVPCKLTVADDELEFDFAGAPPQTDHFFNSKPHIIEAILVGDSTDVLAFDLPLTQGMFGPITVRCPPGTIVNSEPPAPIASAHIDVAINATTAAQQCLMLALTASDPVEASHLLCGPLAVSAMALQIWSYLTPNGTPNGWMMMDGSLAGNSAGHDRDGTDLWTFMVARKPILEAIDVEMLEWWHPLLVDFKRMRAGAYGAGRNRGGAGCHMQFRPHGTKSFSGSLLAIREEFPLAGVAGGSPGATSEFLLHHEDRPAEDLAGKSSGVVVGEGDALEFRLGSGGGYGDPLDREPTRVALDVRHGRFTAAEAEQMYGVVLSGREPDIGATAARREGLRRGRLSAAAPARRPGSAGTTPPADLAARPLYPGVEQRGHHAVAAESGAVLAVAPDPWTDGCPTITRALTGTLVERSYLDPETGRVLLTEVVPDGVGCAIEVSPLSWTRA